MIDKTSSNREEIKGTLEFTSSTLERDVTNGHSEWEEDNRRWIRTRYVITFLHKSDTELEICLQT